MSIIFTTAQANDFKKVIFEYLTTPIDFTKLHTPPTKPIPTDFGIITPMGEHKPGTITFQDLWYAKGRWEAHPPIKYVNGFSTYTDFVLWAKDSGLNLLATVLVTYWQNPIVSTTQSVVRVICNKIYMAIMEGTLFAITPEDLEPYIKPYYLTSPVLINATPGEKAMRALVKPILTEIIDFAKLGIDISRVGQIKADMSSDMRTYSFLSSTTMWMMSVTGTTININGLFNGVHGNRNIPSVVHFQNAITKGDTAYIHQQIDVYGKLNGMFGSTFTNLLDLMDLTPTQVVDWLKKYSIDKDTLLAKVRPLIATDSNRIKWRFKTSADLIPIISDKTVADPNGLLSIHQDMLEVSP